MRDKKLIQIYLTNRCNSQCSTCSIWKCKDKEDIQRYILNVFRAFPEADYVIGGGEAILHPHIGKILSYINFLGNINYTLLSNCVDVNTLIDIVKSYNVPAVTVSFDGIGHDKIRGVSGNINSILYFKDWCEFYGVKFKISYTYSKFNEKVFESDMKVIKNVFGQEKIYFCLAQDMKLLMTAEANESFIAHDFEQVLDCNMIEEKDKRHIIGMITGIRRCCTSQNNVHTIYSNGDIVRCQSYMCTDVIGNINNKSIKEIQDMINGIDNISCPYDAECNLLCQRRYD